MFLWWWVSNNWWNLHKNDQFPSMMLVLLHCRLWQVRNHWKTCFTTRLSLIITTCLWQKNKWIKIQTVVASRKPGLSTDWSNLSHVLSMPCALWIDCLACRKRSTTASWIFTTFVVLCSLVVVFPNLRIALSFFYSANIFKLQECAHYARTDITF